MTRAHAPGRTFYSFPARIEDVPERTWVFAAMTTVPEAPSTTTVLSASDTFTVDHIRRALASLSVLDIAERAPRLAPALAQELLDMPYRDELVARLFEPHPPTTGTEIALRMERQQRSRRAHRARPPIILHADAWRGQLWAHPREREPATSRMLGDGEPPMATEPLQVCRTNAPVEPGFRCACGEWYAPEYQPDIRGLILYDVAPGAHPRFVPIGIEVRESDYAHAVIATILDRADVKVLSVEVRVVVIGHRQRESVASAILTNLIDRLACYLRDDHARVAADFDGDEFYRLVERSEHVAYRATSTARQIRIRIPGADVRCVIVITGNERWACPAVPATPARAGYWQCRCGGDLGPIAGGILSACPACGALTEIEWQDHGVLFRSLGRRIDAVWRMERDTRQEFRQVREYRVRSPYRVAVPPPSADRGVNGTRPLPSQHDDAALDAELIPDVTPPSPETWAAQNAKIDAAAKPRTAIDYITRCAGNAGGALFAEGEERV